VTWMLIELAGHLNLPAQVLLDVRCKRCGK
jgi:hypothetical protein